MSTPITIKTQLQTLIDNANTVTGNSDTDLTTAVDSLISGYGGGEVKEEQVKSLDITKNGTYTITPDEDKVLSSATVNVDVSIPDGYIQPSGELNIEENGTYDVTAYASAAVNIASGSSGLPMWNGIVTQTMNVSYMYITHNLNSDKLLILAETVGDITPNTNYQSYRIIAWSQELLTPHKKYPYGDYTNEAYADESVGLTINRPSNMTLNSGSASSKQLVVSDIKRNQSNAMVHSADKNMVTWYLGGYFGVGDFNVTVIDISNAGISFSE